MKRAPIVLISISAFLILISGAASAAIVNLTYEFDGDLSTQTYGTVEIDEVVNPDDTSKNALDITITANTTLLGSNADIHEFYFNTAYDAELANLRTIPLYGLKKDPSVLGGAGSGFEWGINFGNGSPILNPVSFLLIDNLRSLSIEDLWEFADPSPNNLPDGVEGVHMAVHFQSTSPNPPGSETIGGTYVPLPSSFVLLATGFFGWVGLRIRKK